MSSFARSLQQSRPVREIGRIARRAAVAAQFAVIVLALAGPIPVGHDHGALAANGEEIPELVEHLKCYHGCISFDSCAGWHLHWVWIGDEADGLTGASRTAASQTMIVGSETPAQSLELAGSLNLWWEDHDGERSFRPQASRPDQLDSAPYFFSTFACRRSLPERLGVIRC